MIKIIKMKYLPSKETYHERMLRELKPAVQIIFLLQLTQVKAINAVPR